MSIYNTLLVQYKNYSGEPPVPPTPGPDYTEPFYVESNGWLHFAKAGYDAPALTIEYSKDRNTWKTLGTTQYNSNISILNDGKTYFRCKTNTWASIYYNNKWNKITSDVNCSIGGNIMSLLYGSDFTGNEKYVPSSSYKYNFCKIFSNLGAKLISAENLLLPCLNLTERAYYGMFDGCSSIQKSPVIPDAVLGLSAFQYMFKGCSSLNEITCMLTNYTDSTYNWTNGVAATGRFITPSSTQWTTGVSGIPEGWIRVDAT